MRRGFGIVALVASLAVASASLGQDGSTRIDRHALVVRHNPVSHAWTVDAPLSVGNGELAFTADATGLQTFPDEFGKTIPLCTLSQWGWHTAPNPDGWRIDKFQFTDFDSRGRKVGYADIPGDRPTPEVSWLRENPHRLHLGQIGFRLVDKSGRAATPQDVSEIEQTLDLWNGALISHFNFDGEPVVVETICHPDRDILGVRLESPLAADGRLAIRLRFPYGTGAATAADWTRPKAHVSKLIKLGDARANIERRLDNDHYSVALNWSRGATLVEEAPHEFLLTPHEGTMSLELVCALTLDEPASDLPSFEATRSAARQHWNKFWSTGGAIDLSGSRDSRWQELERRIVLSQYLTAIQCSGRYPPQETGLTCNSWAGKFHLEMHWWHAVHFALWDRPELLERSLGYYQAILSRARATAERQGYAGARWPKMTDPSGAESPSTIGPFLVWQEPHPIYYAELCRRIHGDHDTLEKYKPVVFATADFMASFAALDETTGRYVLGPPLQCAQERFPKESTFNPTFELTYWRWGLETAQHWRELLGLPLEPAWERVLRSLAAPSVQDGKYLFAESAPNSYSNPAWVHDHPAVLGAYGMLAGPGIDPRTMRHTLRWVWDNWEWADAWGWDYPLMAMTAARLGEPQRAVDALLRDAPKNRYGASGHNYQRPDLSVYLPGNGGLLTAVGMMAAGWDGAPSTHAPGFPSDGSWQVRWEGLHPLP